MLNVKQDGVGHKGLLFAKFGPEYVNKHRLQNILATQPDSKSAKNWRPLMKSAAGWSSYQQIPPISDHSGLVHVSAKDRAEVLNAAFARQCSAPSTAHPPSLSTSSSSFAFQPITEESTFKALRGVPIRKASGLDDLPARLLFECAAEIAAPLCYIFNLSLSPSLSLSLPLSLSFSLSFSLSLSLSLCLSLSSGLFPSQWKKCLHSASLQEQR